MVNYINITASTIGRRWEELLISNTNPVPNPNPDPDPNLNPEPDPDPDQLHPHFQLHFDTGLKVGLALWQPSHSVFLTPLLS